MERRDIRYLIITAGGSGTRMASPVPKQFIRIGGHPILRRTIDRFISYSPDFRIILVLPDDKRRLWLDYCEQAGYSIGPHIIASGGITRFHSVKNALKYVERGAVAAVHDGVRPFPPLQVLDSVFKLSYTVPAVCPAIPSSDTLRRLERSGNSVFSTSDIDRSSVYRVQTPQVFHSEILINAYDRPYSDRFTDDASVVEASGCKVRYVPGSKYNIKITTPEDLVIAGKLYEAGL